MKHIVNFDINLNWVKKNQSIQIRWLVLNVKNVSFPYICSHLIQTVPHKIYPETLYTHNCDIRVTYQSIQEGKNYGKYWHARHRSLKTRKKFIDMSLYVKKGDMFNILKMSYANIVILCKLN